MKMRWGPWAGFLLPVAIAWGASVGGVLAPLDRMALDAGFALERRIAPAPVAPERDVVVVGIDERFLDGVEEPLALSHAYLARFLGILAEAGPRAVGLDIVMPDRRYDGIVRVDAPDTDFHRTLLMGLMQATQAYPVVVAKAWDPDRGRFRDLQVDYAAVLGMQGDGFEPLGSVLLCLDADERIRRYPGADCQPDRRDATFAGEIAAAMGRRGGSSGLIDYRLGGQFAYVPLQEVFAVHEAGDTGRLRQLFSGRAVLLGAVLDETDLVNLPVPLAEWRPDDPRVPGVLAHAQIVRSLLHGGLVHPLDGRLHVLLVLAFGLLWFMPRPWWRLALFASGAAGLCIASLLLLRAGVWLSPVAPILAGGLATAGGGVLSRRAASRWQRRIDLAFSGRVGDDVLRRLRSRGLDVPVAEARRICLLACDVRMLADAAAATGRLDVLNGGLDALAGIVRHYGGTVEGFTGRRVVAVFGAPAPLAGAEQSAMEAAHAVLRAFAESGRAPVTIALHACESVVGCVEYGERTDFAVVGTAADAVIALLASAGPDDPPILCSEPVAAALGHPAILQPLAGPADVDGEPMLRFGWKPRDLPEPSLPRRPFPDHVQ